METRSFVLVLEVLVGAVMNPFFYCSVVLLIYHRMCG